MPMLSMVTKVEKSGETWILLSADPVGWKVCRASPFATSHHWQTNQKETLSFLEFKEMNENSPSRSGILPNSSAHPLPSPDPLSFLSDSV